MASSPNFTPLVVGQSVVQPDGAAMWCLLSTGPAHGHYWIVKYAGVAGVCQNSPIQVVSPLSGLFLVPVNQIAETLAEGQTMSGVSPGMALAKRGVPLPCDMANVPTGAAVGGGQPQFFFSCTLGANGEILVPYGYTLLAVYTANPGGPEPGPGAQSRCSLTVFVLDVDPTQPLVGTGNL